MAFLLSCGNSVNKSRKVCTWKGIGHTESTTPALSGTHERIVALRGEIFRTSVYN